MQFALQCGIAYEGKLDLGMRQDIACIIEGHGRVKRHADGADLLQRQIGQHPFYGIVGGNGDLVAAGDAQFQQTQAEAVDAVRDFLCRQPAPFLAGLGGEAIGSRVAFELAGQDVKYAF